jgi:hypothetical protein
VFSPREKRLATAHRDDEAALVLDLARPNPAAVAQRLEGKGTLAGVAFAGGEHLVVTVGSHATSWRLWL